MQQRKRRLCPWRSASALGRSRSPDCRRPPADEPKRLVRRYYEDVLSGRRVDLLEQLIADEFTGHDSAGATMDRAEYIAAVRILHAAFGELTVTIDDQIAERDRVSTRWSAIGRHTGAYAGIAPTGREVLLAGTDIHRLAGGQLVEHWEQADLASLLAQLM